MDRTTNMTTGNPTKLILTFSLPLIAANIGQQLYTMIDAIIVGQGVGVDALAAVGATDWAYWLALWVMGSMTQGFAVPISQYFGDNDFKQLKKAITASIGLCTVIGIGLTIICLLIANPLLHLLNTPDNIFPGALTYLTTMYSGILIVMAYNMSASILRALGDGKSPLIAIVIAGFTNVGLDILFVLIFKWGILGAAIATLTAQLLACLYCFYVLRKISFLKLEKSDWKPDKEIIKTQCWLGLPLALQHVFIVIGGMILQSAVNQFGMIFIAGYTATNKLYGLLESSGLSVGFALMTYTAQNYGASLFDRIRIGLKSTLKVAMAISTAITIIMIVFGKFVLRLFIDSSNANASEVLAIAYRYLVILCVLLFILYLLHIFRNTLQGLGDSVTSFWSGIMEFIGRVAFALIFTKMIGETGVFLAEPAAWTGATLVLGIVCIKKVRALPKNNV